MARTHTVLDSPIGPLTVVRDGCAVVALYLEPPRHEGAAELLGRRDDAGLAVAALALALRAPFIVVLVLAGATGALVHVLAG